MNASKLRLVVAAIAVMFAGCSNKNGAGGIVSGPYTADYKITSPDEVNGYMEVAVRGPAAKLAVIVTKPDGESKVMIIEKDQMMNNYQTVKMLFDDPRAGKWVLAVKTVDPEKVVWKKDISLSRGKLAINDVKLDLGKISDNTMYGGKSYYLFFQVKVGLNAEGNLPVTFSDVSVALDGDNGFCRGIGSGRTMVGQQHELCIDMSFPPTRGGMPGERHVVKGVIHFGEDRQSLEFEKEFVVPTGNGTGAVAQNTRVSSTTPARRIGAPVAPAPIARQ